MSPVEVWYGIDTEIETNVLRYNYDVREMRSFKRAQSPNIVLKSSHMDHLRVKTRTSSRYEYCLVVCDCRKFSKSQEKFFGSWKAQKTRFRALKTPLGGRKTWSKSYTAPKFHDIEQETFGLLHRACVLHWNGVTTCGSKTNVSEHFRGDSHNSGSTTWRTSDSTPASK